MEFQKQAYELKIKDNLKAAKKREKERQALLNL